MRVIVAGAPTWRRPDVVRDALELVADEAARRTQWLTVVHGHAPKGAEHDADVWALAASRAGRHVERPERHPARWNAPCQPICPRNHRRRNDDGTSACPSAGFHRNDAIVAAGADFYLAFIDARMNHRGTTHLMQAVQRAGIDGQVFTL